MAPSAWVEAPPVTGEGFAYAEGEFFAEASGHNRHRRATPAELQAHFASGNERDHAAHWFEAQLMHYGLPVSKTKAVARMRLFDAVNAGKLEVPGRVARIEGELKKEWVRRRRVAMKGEEGKSTRKRALEADEEMVTKKCKTTTVKTTTVKTTTVKTTGGKAAASKTTEPKKTTPKTTPKTTKPKDTTPKKATPKKATAKAAAPKPKTAGEVISLGSGPIAVQEPPASQRPPRTKETARRSGGWAGRGRIQAPSSPTVEQPRRGLQTARRSGGWAGQGRVQAPSSPTIEQSRPLRQTARRSGGWVGLGRMPVPQWSNGSNDYDNDYGNDYGHGPDEAPPPYSTYDQGDNNQSPSKDDKSLGALGLLNGSYHVTCDTDHSYHGTDFEISLALSGTQLWGRFDLGILQGVIRFEQRPWRSSHDYVPFTWRGQEQDGPISYGDSNGGAIKFLGNGRIEGYLRELTFEGCRLEEGFGAVNAREYKEEWATYTEERYNYEARARWGGSSSWY